jgi:hypothetical protein
MSDNSSFTHTINDFNFEYSSLIGVNIDGTDKYLQFNEKKNDGIKYNFYYKGNNVNVSIYEEN